MEFLNKKHEYTGLKFNTRYKTHKHTKLIKIKTLNYTQNILTTFKRARQERVRQCRFVRLTRGE